MTKEETLQEALTYAGCPELPEVERDGDVWINAIALVHKTNGSSAYVIMGRTSKSGEKTIVKDIGDMAGIHTIESIHPYKFLKQSFIPDCFKTKEDIIKFLSFRNNLDRTFFEGFTNDQLLDRIYAEAIKDQNSREMRDREDACYGNKPTDKLKNIYDVGKELKATTGNESISAINKEKEKENAKGRAEKRAKGSASKTSKQLQG